MNPEQDATTPREKAERVGTSALERSRSARLRGGTLADAAVQAKLAEHAFAEADSKLGVAIAIYEQAVIERLLRTDLPHALELQQDALSRFRELGSARWQSASLCELAALDRTVGNARESKLHLHQALELAEKADEALLIANACLELATVRRLQGDAQLALPLIERAVTLYRPLGGAGLPNALLEQSKVLQRLGPISDSAVANAREASSLFGSRNHHLGVANAELQLGTLAVLRTSLVTAKSHLEKALNLYRQVDEPLGLGVVLRELARLHLLASDFAEAELFLKEALDINDRLGERNRDPYGECNLLRQIAQVRRLLGDDDMAEEHLRRCLRKLQGTDDRAGEAHTRRALAYLLMRRGNWRRARHGFRRALRLDVAMAEPHGVITTRSQLASLELRMGRRRSALHHLQAACAVADVHGSPLLRVRARRLSTRAMAPELAVVELERLRGQALPLRIPLELASIEVDLALRLREMGDARQALEAVCRAIDLSERLRGNLTRDVDRETLYAEWRDRHLLAIQLAAQLGDGNRALRIGDAARGEGLSAAILAGPMAVGTQLAESLAAVRLATNAQEESEALRVLESVASPALRRFISPAHDVDYASRLQPGVDVLLYEVNEQNRRPIIYCVWAAHGATPRVFTAGLDRSGAATLVGLGAGDRWRGGLLPESLRAALIPSPLSDAMRSGEVRQLLVVPAGPLWSVPFAALQLDGQPLLRRAEIVYAPSLSASLNIDAVVPDFSGPPIAYLRQDLPGIEREREVLLQGECEFVADSELAWRFRESAGCQFAAISAHGDRSPGLGQALDLSDGRRLSGHDILGGHLARTVVLGACWAASVDPVRGGEPLGLPTACLAAGASVVVGAMHLVHSESTGTILATLYAGLLQRERPVDALRRAQLHRFDDAAGNVPLREWAGLIAVGRH